MPVACPIHVPSKTVTPNAQPACPCPPPAQDARGGSSSLDALETTQQLAPASSPSRKRLFGDRLDLADKIALSLDAEPERRWAKRVSRLFGCCSMPFLACSPSGRPVMSLGRCRDRLCPFCSQIRCRQVGARVAFLIAKADAPKLITLTLREDQAKLSDRMSRLLNCFRDLRRRKVWRDNVRAGLAAIEVTRGASGDGWHVHLHAVVDASYIPQDLLSGQWEDVTGDSPIVDIRAIYDRARATTYVAKYVTKPAELSRWTAAELRDYADGMHRRRTLITFGAWHNLACDTDEPEDHDATLSDGCSVGRIRWAARRGCRAAITCEVLAAKAGGLWARAMGVPDASMRKHGDADPMTDEHWKEFGEAIRQVQAWCGPGGDRIAPAPRPPPHPRLW